MIFPAISIPANFLLQMSLAHSVEIFGFYFSSNSNSLKISWFFLFFSKYPWNQLIWARFPLFSRNRFKHSTVWKIQHFSVTHILREINFGERKRSTNAIFAISETWNLWFGYISAIRKCKNSWKIRNQGL